MTPTLKKNVVRTCPFRLTVKQIVGRLGLFFIKRSLHFSSLILLHWSFPHNWIYNHCISFTIYHWFVMIVSVLRELQCCRSSVYSAQPLYKSQSYPLMLLAISCLHTIWTQMMHGFPTQPPTASEGVKWITLLSIARPHTMQWYLGVVILLVFSLCLTHPGFAGVLALSLSEMGSHWRGGTH